jgi:hypothetical protein
MNEDDQDDGDLSEAEWEASIEAAYRRMQQGLPPERWLPRVVNLVGLRRQARRARAGVIEPGNPRISPRAWADTLEQGIVMNVLESREQKQQIAEEQRVEAERQQFVLEYNRRWMDVYRQLQRLPAAKDPDSEVAVQIESMKRELRKLRGRRRRRAKGK